eukprot:427704-Amphidinium_carterae.3
MQIAGQVAGVCNQQQGLASRWFLVENPQRSDLWRIPEIATLIQEEGVQLLTFDQCMYGLKNDKGELHKKPTRKLTNLPMAEKYLSTRSSNDHSHTRLEGEQVQKAQTWLARLTQVIVKTIGKVLSEGVREHTFPVVYDLCRGRKSALDLSYQEPTMRRTRLAFYHSYPSRL